MALVSRSLLIGITSFAKSDLWNSPRVELSIAIYDLRWKGANVVRDGGREGAREEQSLGGCRIAGPSVNFSRKLSKRKESAAVKKEGRGRNRRGRVVIPASV